MRYCKNCGNRLDDLDGYCSSCGAKVDDSFSPSEENCSKNDSKQDKRTSIEDAINNLTASASQNPESFLCLLLGIFSVTFGTFICGIASLILGNKAVQKGQTNDGKCAIFCKIGKICSIISIVLTAVITVLLIILVPLIFVNLL